MFRFLSVMIAATDEAGQTASGYFFSRPSDTFSAVGTAVAVPLAFLVMVVVSLLTPRTLPPGVTTIMVEQNARRCLQICDRGYVLDQGKDAYTGTGRDMLNDPKVIELYLGTLAADVDADKSAPASAAAPVASATAVASQVRACA